MQKVLGSRGPHSPPGSGPLRMDSAACVAAATAVPALALALAPDLAQAPLALPGLLSPSPLLSSGKEVDGSER